MNVPGIINTTPAHPANFCFVCVDADCDPRAMATMTMIRSVKNAKQAGGSVGRSSGKAVRCAAAKRSGSSSRKYGTNENAAPWTGRWGLGCW